MRRGANDPMSSSILTAWQPDEITSIDIRVRVGLNLFGIEFEDMQDIGSTLSYAKFCVMMREISKRCNSSLRNLDRVLPNWDRPRTCT